MTPTELPNRPRSLGDLVAWLHAAPPGTLLEAAAIAQEIANASAPVSIGVAEPTPASWRERLWTAAAGVRIPHRKLEGELVFVVGDLRTWISQNEQVVVASRIALMVAKRSKG